MPWSREDQSGLKAMPFGKYKNVPIEELPVDYLAYVIDNFDPNKHPDIYEMCENEYIRRKKQGGFL